MTEIYISGLRAASKKNNRRNFGHISLPSKAYEKFHSLCAEFLLPYAYRITKPFRMHVSYTIKGKYHQDLDNALSSILDVLVDYNVIPDDEYCMEIRANKGNGKDWLIVIRLEEI
jgi:Holliday junction resolvase RusA-like endonuclease